MVSKNALEKLIVGMIDNEDMSLHDVKEELEIFYDIGLNVRDIESIYEMHWEGKTDNVSIRMPDVRININDAHIKRTMKKVVFLDIETSLVDARVFRTGKQAVTASQMTGVTKILTVAGGSFYDLYTKGEKGV